MSSTGPQCSSSLLAEISRVSQSPPPAPTPATMSLADPDDDLVSAVSLHRARPPVLHGYIAPFLLAYLAWLYTWLVHIGYEEGLEAGYVVGAAIVLLNVLVVLSCHWSVTVMAVMTCNTVQAKDAVLAEWAKVDRRTVVVPWTDHCTLFQVVPSENNGFAEMVRVARTGPYPLWFTFQKLKYVWDTDKKVLFCTVSVSHTPNQAELRTLINVEQGAQPPRPEFNIGFLPRSETYWKTTIIRKWNPCRAAKQRVVSSSAASGS